MGRFWYKNLVWIVVTGIGLSYHSSFASSIENDSSVFRREITLIVDNDVYTSLFRDQYYSSGLFGTFRWLHDSDQQSKIIRSITLIQRMYTPHLVSYARIEQMDRPYAGLISLLFAHEKLSSTYALLHEVELGWMGPGSMTGTIQEHWHKAFNMPLPQGWQYQIQNSPIINYYNEYNRSLYQIKNLEIISESNLAVGTVFNNFRQELLFRLGNFRSIDQGVLYRGQLGKVKPKSKTQVADEVFLFYAPGLEYNAYNATIEGNIIGKTPPHTEEAERWIVQHRFGLYFSWASFDMTIDYYRRTKETSEALPHQYAGVKLSTRF